MILVIFILICIGAAMYVVNRMPIDPPWKQIIYVIVVLATVFWLLSVFGLIDGSRMHLPNR